MEKDTGRQDADPGQQDDEGQDADLDQDNGDEGQGDEETWTPPSREDWDKAKKRRDNATKELRNLRKELADLKKAAETGTAPEADALKKDVERWRGVAVKQAASAALSAAGFSGSVKQAARLTRLMDLDTAEPSSDGTFDFDDEVEELKAEYPSLFAGEESTRKRTPRVRTGSGRVDDQVKDPTRRTSDALLKSAGYR